MASGGFARDELEWNDLGHGLGGLESGGQLEDECGGETAHGEGVLIDGGEGDFEQVGEGEVAYSDDGDVLGNAQAGVEDGAHGSAGDEVGVGEDAVRWMGGLEQRLHGAVAGVDAIAATGDETLIDTALVVAQGVEEALFALLAAGDGRTLNVGDALAAAGDQVFGGGAADGDSVAAYEIGGEVGLATAGKDEGNAGIGEDAKFGGVFEGARGAEEKAFHAMGEEGLDLCVFKFGAVFGIAEVQEVALAAEGGGCAVGEFGEVGQFERRHDEADGFGAAAEQLCREGIGAVVERMGAFDDAAAGLFTDIGVTAERFGNGHGADAEVGGDVLEANGADAGTRFHGRVTQMGELQAVWPLACSMRT